MFKIKQICVFCKLMIWLLIFFPYMLQIFLNKHEWQRFQLFVQYFVRGNGNVQLFLTDLPTDHTDTVTEILKELSNHNTR